MFLQTILKLKKRIRSQEKLLAIMEKQLDQNLKWIIDIRQEENEWISKCLKSMQENKELAKKYLILQQEHIELLQQSGLKITKN